MRIALGLFAGALLFLPGASAAAEHACALPVAVAAASTQSPRLTSFTGASDTERVRTVDQVGSTILVGTNHGLFRLRGDELTRLGGSIDTGQVVSVHQIDRTTLIYAGRGLFRLEGNDLVKVKGSTTVGKVRSVHQIDGWILILADWRVFRLEGNDLIEVKRSWDSPDRLQNLINMMLTHDDIRLYNLGNNGLTSPPHTAEKSSRGGQVQQVGDAIFISNGSTLVSSLGSVRSVQELGGIILVGSEQGLFRLDGNDLERIGASTETGAVSSVQQIGDATLVQAKNGLFRLEGNHLRRIGANTGAISSVQQIGSAILVSAEKGLFRLEGSEMTRLGAGTDTGAVSSAQQIGDATLVSAEKGLFRLMDNDLTRLGSGSDIGKVRLVEQAGDVILVSAENGLYRLDGEGLQEVMSDSPMTGMVRWAWIGGRLSIRTDDGMLRYTTETYRAVGPDHALPLNTVTKTPVEFNLSPCLGVLPAGRFALIRDLSSPAAPASSAPTIAASFRSEGPPTQRVLTATVHPLPAGTWRVRLAVRAGEGWEPVSPPVELRVGWAWDDYILHYLLLAAPVLGYAHTLVFVLLLAGARRSAWCWRVVSDPVWGRAGLWWHFALRHVPALQRWVLARWYDTVRHGEVQPYIPVPLAVPDGTTVAADSLLDRLGSHRRLWVQGGTGMGKSALVEEISRRFFGDHAGLRVAYRRYGFIPIVVRLRDTLDLKVDPAQPDRWVSELARMALRANGLRVNDAALFRAILEGGGFALILDGANETANAAALEDYARTTPEVRILVTSQADPAKPGFEVLRLPGTVEGLVGPLLALLLGSERGGAVLETVRPTPLWPELTSGYDVRLLADLAGRNGPVPDLPADRIGLYRTLLARLRYAGDPYPEAELSRAAWAMWRDGVRRFDGTKYLTADLIEPLRHEEARVVRTIGGVLYEFRHDQMRGYLAALWAARHEVAPISLFETDKAIWRLGVSEQAVVWEFFAALVDRARGEAIWQWCHEEPERAILQHALDRRGRQEGWTLVRRTLKAETKALLVQSHG